MLTATSARWRLPAQRISNQPLPKDMDAAWDACVGWVGRFVPRSKKCLKRAERIVDLEKDFSNLTDARLRSKAEDLRAKFRCNRDDPSDLEQAFALVREVAVRQIGERPYPVQVAGALALDAGCVAEMATGEGKTLAATMPVTVAGWRGKGCHVITVNDYLAKRDAEWMGAIYRFCGLRVGYIEQAMPSEARRQAYDADVTYCTNKEVAADFLRDRLIMGPSRTPSDMLVEKIASGRSMVERLVQRGLHFAIVDEADSILVDEAITPLIISGEAPNPQQCQAFQQAAMLAPNMARALHYRVNLRYRDIELTNEGKEKLRELSAPLGDVWTGTRRREEIMLQALTAKEFYERDKQYVVDDGRIVIVDEFTGRLMPDREWRDGLHQAVEAKENVQVNTPKDTYARISFQRFFRLYKKLAGMTGTAQEAASEFWQIYHLPVVAIPTNRPCIRKTLTTIVLPTQSEKWKVIVQEICRMHQTGRPILVGTRSVQASEHLSQLLSSASLDHQVLNAIHHKQEAEIVAGAGRTGRITVATNMAGRGTDIKLGRGVAELGGLHVLSTELNESARIDRQLFGRCARQGDPGTAQAIVSLEDEYVCRYAQHIAAFLRKRFVSGRKNGSAFFTRRAFHLAQHRAARLALRQRKSVLKTDNWLDDHLGFAGSE
jgi:preprotein translocase subunit SecA